jgi:hypothetical protein
MGRSAAMTYTSELYGYRDRKTGRTCSGFAYTPEYVREFFANRGLDPERYEVIVWRTTYDDWEPVATP